MVSPEFIVSVITAVSLVVGVWRSIIETRRNTVKIEDTKSKLEEVHVIVNNRYDDLVTYVATLSAELEKANVHVPSPFNRSGVEGTEK